MQKLTMHTANIADQNFQKLAALFPQAVTESVVDGKVVRAINKDVLMQEIGMDVIDGSKQCYQFTWPDKAKTVHAANQPLYKTLRPCREESVNFDTTENLYIEGDNLEVLKLLQETYLGKVKMIYIDPPYNTGNDFVYNDKFSINKDDYDNINGNYDDKGNRLFKNTESNGRFHTDWLNMMYPRLKVARDLLSDDGVIFMSIDDNEVHNLRKIADEIFGESNFVANIVWQSRTSISNDFNVSNNHNHTIIYARNESSLIFGGDKLDSVEYINPDSDPRGPWKLVPIDANHVGGATYYPIKNPKNGIDYYPPNGRIWAYNEQTFKELLNDDRIMFGLKGESAPKKKLFLNERLAKGDKKTPSSILVNAGTTRDGTEEIVGLFSKKIFDYPKPTKFLYSLLQYGAVSKTGIILDFFSGSATTAHAVMQLNAEDGGKRKFIMIQVPEVTDEKSEAYKAGYTNICEIGKERIRRAGAKILETMQAKTEDGNAPLLSMAEQKKEGAQLDMGFRVLKVDESNMVDIGRTPSTTTYKTLMESVDNIKQDRTAEDLLFDTMLRIGVPLSAKIEKKSMHDKTVFFVYYADMLYLAAGFDKALNEALITDIAQMKPLHFVMRDASQETDSMATNFEEIFKLYSPSTKRWVL